MPNRKRILVIDDEESMRDSCTQILRKDRYGVETAPDGDSGLRKVRETNPDLVLIDLKMPGMSGMEVLEQIKTIDPSITSVVITGYATIESAVEATKRGAYDYLPKPFTPDELRIIVKRGLERRTLTLDAEALREERRKLQDNFITLVSHELRTPLVAVQQYCDTIAEGFAGEVASGQRKMLERIRDRVSGMLKLIGDWLNLARIEEGKLVHNFKLISLRTVITQAVEDLRMAAEAQEITTEIQCPPGDALIEGDEETMRLVFANLIGNAIKYNSKRGRVEIKIEEDQDWVRVAVTDTGLGIPEESLPFIFDQFYRVKRKEQEDSTGSGLGLSIAKRIIEAHSGAIRVASELGRGSTFTVLLPSPRDRRLRKTASKTDGDTEKP